MGSGAPDLVAALSAIQQELGIGPDLDFRVSAIGPKKALLAPIREELYRIGKEALVNAFRHSRAGRVDLEFDYTHNYLSMRVRDNGCGIAPQMLEQGLAGHWGLAGMRAGRERRELRVSVHPTTGKFNCPSQVMLRSNSPDPMNQNQVESLLFDQRTVTSISVPWSDWLFQG